MKTTKLLFFLIVLLVGWCSDTNAAVLTVTNSNDAGVGSLRNTCTSATAGDVIVFAASTNGVPIVLTTGQITLGIDITISGNGVANTILDGNNASRIFNLTGGNVTIIKLTIRNGRTPGFVSGGGIANSSSGMSSIDSCQFISCFATADGGGIINTAGTLNISRSTFDGNHADYDGGGIRINSGTVNITGCTFVNGTTGFSGAGIRRVGGTVTVSNTTITNNTANYNGGGFEGTMTFTNCTIANNQANNGGGAKPAGSTLSNCIVYGNTATGVGPDLDGSIVSGGYNIIGSASGSGGFAGTDLFVNPILGALANNGGPTRTMAISCSSPAVNAANPAASGVDQRGLPMVAGRRDIGAFENQDAGSLLVTSIANSGPGTLRDLVSGACDGAMITFDNSINGSAIVLTTGEIVVNKNITIVGNGVANTIIDGNNASRIFNLTGGDVTIKKLTIRNGRTPGFASGGGIANSSSGMSSIDSCQFKSCFATADGGGIINTAGTLNISRSTFDGNHADFDGGGIRINSGTVSISGCTFVNGTTGFSGAGIRKVGGTVTVSNTTITNNTANLNGGGFEGTMTFTNCTIANNQANNGGGAKPAGSSLSNCIVYGNTATGVGPDLDGSIVSGGYNIIGSASGSGGFAGTDLFVNPLLGALANNGGPTQTMAIDCSSPAVNAANPAASGADQRGLPMVAGRRDIGAFENQTTCCTAPTFSACPTSPILKDNDVNQCSAVTTYSVAATGTPDPTLTYAFSGATTKSSTSGTGSGETFNKGTTTVVVTATNTCGAPTCTFNVVVNDTEAPAITCPESATVNNTPGLCSAVVNFAAPTATDNCPGVTISETFNYTGAMQTWTVPAGVTSVNISAFGAQGSNPNDRLPSNSAGGLGGSASGALAVTPGEVLTIIVGGQGSSAGTGGYNGGGFAGFGFAGGDCSGGFAGAGGGASDVRVGGFLLTNRVIVAGGGGGAGRDYCNGSCQPCGCGGGGGGAGGLTGGNGLAASDCGFSYGGSGTNLGGGASQVAGGAAGVCDGFCGNNGTMGTSGTGGTGSGGLYDVAGGGGGGGYFGGGGGGGANNGSGVGGGGGGGGSSYIGGVTSGTTTPGVQSGNGKVIISWVDLTVTQVGGLPSGSSFPVGATTNTFLANDASGNTATCSFTVTVKDVEAPTVTCKTYNANLSAAGTTSITTANVFQSGADNCSTVNQITVLPNTFTCANVGANTVVLTVNDGNGNSSTCSAVVTVADNIPPTALCKNISLSLNNAGTISTNAAAVNNGSSDNCGNVSLVLSKTTFNCSNFGPNTVVLTVTDNSSNIATCSSIITIGYGSLPVAKCRNAIVTLSSAGNGSITTSGINNASTDLCSANGLTLALSKTTFNCSNVGSNVVTLTVTNVAGLSSTCTGTVTVKDLTKPVAKCKAASATVATGGTVTVLPSAVNNVSTDACTSPPNLSLAPSTFTCANAGPNTVILTVSDASNNISTCSAVVTITCTGGSAPEKEITTSALADYTELLDLFPNPAADKVNIRLSRAVNAAAPVTILDNTGRTLYSSWIAEGSSQLQIDLNQNRISSGIYLVSVKMKDRVQTKSLVIFRE